MTHGQTVPTTMVVRLPCTLPHNLSPPTAPYFGSIRGGALQQIILCVLATILNYIMDPDYTMLVCASCNKPFNEASSSLDDGTDVYFVGKKTFHRQCIPKDATEIRHDHIPYL
ncbi:MAG: hypothetical protein PHC39_04715 [Proteiniphilum sp.]|nr:hypothetical protein [Proteiniphilum sp.]